MHQLISNPLARLSWLVRILAWLFLSGLVLCPWSNKIGLVWSGLLQSFLHATPAAQILGLPGTNDFPDDVYMILKSTRLQPSLTHLLVGLLLSPSIRYIAIWTRPQSFKLPPSSLAVKSIASLKTYLHSNQGANLPPSLPACHCRRWSRSTTPHQTPVSLSPLSTHGSLRSLHSRLSRLTLILTFGLGPQCSSLLAFCEYARACWFSQVSSFVLFFGLFFRALASALSSWIKKQFDGDFPWLGNIFSSSIVQTAEVCPFPKDLLRLSSCP